MASTSRALLLSLNPFFLSSNHHHNNLSFLSPPRHHLPPHPLSAPPRRRTAVITAMGGGGLSDIRKSEFSREFSVIATMLKRIEPMDTADITKGVSDSAKESMKQTISTMLGILPSEQFNVSVRVSILPLHRLLVSSIITGYTLWNAEYRISLMRNFELSFDSSEARNSAGASETLGADCEERRGHGHEVASAEVVTDSSEQISSSSLKGLSPVALNYIRQLEAELCSTKQELDAQIKDSMQIESDRGNNNLLEYLRSLESYMVTELSQLSSIEVKEVIHELVQNTIERCFEDDSSSEPTDNISIGSIADYQVNGGERYEMITTSRDYLAKLLFWCMLLGHHLRGLENRLHLSCVVRLL